jgi:hypothetical protein
MLSHEQLKKMIEKIVAMKGDPRIQSRIAFLFEKANEDDLSVEERAEYEAYSEANDFLAILEAKARSRLERTD